MKQYIAKKNTTPMSIVDERWSGVESVELDYVWENHFPSPFKTTAKFVHSDEGYTALLSTNEWPLTAVCTETNGAVCKDSCMEFFFTPNENTDSYMNFEINPMGVLHLGIGEKRAGRIHADSIEGVVINSLVVPGKEWRILLHVPYSYMKKYYTEFGKAIKANFYKCGDSTPTRHYSTWNSVGTEAPDYHRPEYFGRIILSDEEI